MIVCVKLDVAEAFKRLWLCLEDAGCFAADLPGKEFGVAGIMTALYLVLTFGWTGAPGEWMVPAWVMQQFHAAWGPARPDWDGPENFTSAFLMDDQVLVEPAVGRRAWESKRLAQEAMASLLGPEALNDKKDQEEGALEEQKLNWGLQYDFLG